MSTVISADNLSKFYRLGALGAVTLKDDFTRWWAGFRNQPDPLRTVGEEQVRSCRDELFWALRDVSFRIKQGEVVGIIGRNGAGKSTLLKILAQVTAPTTGEIKIKGRVASLLEVGTGFHPDLTGRENTFLNGAILGMTKEEIRRKFDEIVAFAGIEEFIDTPVKRYSSGMYVRLAFAVAAHLEPEILIVDEVLAVGDAEFQKKCLGKMENVARGGRTVLFVSHNMTAIAALAPQSLYLVKGELAFTGPTSEAISHYLNDESDDRLTYNDDQRDPERPSIAQLKLKTSKEGNVQVNGDPLEIEVTVWTPRAIKGVCLSLQVFDAHQTNYLHLWLHDATMPICRSEGLHRITCRIAQLRLYMGMYRFRVYLSEPPGGESFQILDGVCPFEVVMGNKQRLFIWYANECAYLEDCSWEATHLSSESLKGDASPQTRRLPPAVTLSTAGR